MEKFTHGGDRKSERVAVGDKVTKDWLYSYRHRARRVEILRELIARVSETAVEPKGVRYRELVKKSGLPSDLSDVVGRLEWLNEHYRKELRELVGMQVKIEEWLEGLSPQDKELVRVRFILGYSMVKASLVLDLSTRAISHRENKIFKLMC